LLLHFLSFSLSTHGSPPIFYRRHHHRSPPIFNTKMYILTLPLYHLI
jgi:hypothetical protein